jgi:glutamyl-tRNA synthetase
MQERVIFAEELVSAGDYFFRDPEEYEPKGVEKRWKDDSAGLVSDYADSLAALPRFDEASLETSLRELAERRGVGAGRVIHPVRLAVSGVSFGPGLFEMLALLGRETVVRRLRRASEVLGPVRS